MTGTHSRNKGRRGEREAVLLLEERGWQIIELGPGRKTEDIIAEDERGIRYSVEVKNHLVWHLTDWRRQAKEQARKRKCHWLLMARVPMQAHTFYVEGTGRESCVWRGNGARGEVTGGVE